MFELIGKTANIRGNLNIFKETFLFFFFVVVVVVVVVFNIYQFGP